MSDRIQIEFAPLNDRPEETLIVLAGHELSLSPIAKRLDSQSGGSIAKAAKTADFKGKSKTSFEVLAPAKLDCSRLIVVGVGKPAERNSNDWLTLGGTIAGQIATRKTKEASVLAEIADVGAQRVDDIAADLALGILLRSYNFRKYKTAKGGDNNASDNNAPHEDIEKVVVHCADHKKAEKAFAARRAVANGVFLARDLVNEPANVLGPIEFADAAKKLESLGVEVEILDVKALTELKMGALLSVGQGSVRPSRVAVMQWNGAKSKRAKPLAFVGKGVVFDTGGISIKPSAGMEDMKGDMGGAACVTGLIHTLAERNAGVNAIGIVGLVENMPSGSASRPGDIVTSMSGQTIEVLNTDAEGRLVLADIIWYAQQRFKPKLVIDLATLTGAIMVALGKDFAGLFANNEKLASDLLDASRKTDEKLWRMPLDKSFDKMIDSKNADVKNLGGRWAGACTAAAFIQRFVKDTPWAHIDIAGPAMDATRNAINQSWGSGWGVRLLDQFIADHHEKSDK